MVLGIHKNISIKVMILKIYFYSKTPSCNFLILEAKKQSCLLKDWNSIKIGKNLCAS